jgi:hypothetical protein
MWSIGKYFVGFLQAHYFSFSSIFTIYIQLLWLAVEQQKEKEALEEAQDWLICVSDRQLI